MGLTSLARELTWWSGSRRDRMGLTSPACEPWLWSGSRRYRMGWRISTSPVRFCILFACCCRAEDTCLLFVCFACGGRAVMFAVSYSLCVVCAAALFAWVAEQTCLRCLIRRRISTWPVLRCLSFACDRVRSEIGWAWPALPVNCRGGRARSEIGWA